MVIYTLVLSYLSIRRHLAFASGYDLANMVDIVWQTSQGHFFALTGSSGLVSRFTIHSDLILVLLAPFYRLYSSPNLLLIIQSFAIAISVVPIFLISKILLPRYQNLGVLIGLVFLINPHTLWANIYDFHPILLAIPLLFFALYCFLIKKWFLFWLLISLSLLTKENVGLLVSMFGVLVFLKLKNRSLGITLFLLGLSFSFFAIKLLMPLFSSGQSHWALGWYSFPSGIVPKVWHDLTKPESLKYYQDLLLPYSFLPLLALPWLLPAIPDLVINLISDHGEMKGLVFHYHTLTLIVLTFALILAFSYLVKHRLLLIISIFVLIFCSLRQNYFYSPLPTTPGHWRLMYQITDNEINFEKILKQIPFSATVASSSEVRPHVINHPLSFNLPSGVNQADYIAIVSQNRLVGNYEPKTYELELLNTLKTNPQYQPLYQVEPFYLFKKINP